MELRLVPAADRMTLDAVAAAIADAELDLDEPAPVYGSLWRLAALAAGVRQPLGDDDRF